VKIVILAGGKGSRLFELTKEIPKPLVSIGDKPIIWHIMQLYAHYGYKDFIIASGYKGGVLREQLPKYCEADWNIEIIDTGLETTKAHRIKQLENLIDDTFMLTWGDGVSDIDIDKLIEHHKRHGKIATITAVPRPRRFGYMELENDLVTRFSEKIPLREEWINGAFFVLEPEIFSYITDSSSLWEEEILANLIAKGELSAYKHRGFWKCMDTLCDKTELESLWNSSKPWKIWSDKR
jgi:glucose-1-phosphate cytidylyltransferase